MEKYLFLIEGPVDTQSGYGSHCRDLIKSLFKMKRDDYEYIIVPTRWGECPWGALNPEDPEDKQILDAFIKTEKIRMPDIYLQVTVPNEAKRVGKFNILVTAGIETTIAAAPWIEGLNRMDLIIVPSLHAKNVFLNSVWNPQDPNQPVLKVEKPIEILFEGIDEKIYGNIKPNIDPTELSILSIKPKSPIGNISKTLSSIQSNFNFLFVGHWLKGELGQDRKDVGMLIHTFLETFKDLNNQPGLILKTSGGNYSPMDRDDILRKINIIKSRVSGKLPKIYLLHGDLTDKEMNALYRHEKVKAMVSFTKGEGWGRPGIEFCTTGKPYIVSNWSGHLDYCNPSSTILLPGQITQIHPSAVWQNVLIPESGWFTVNYNEAKKILKDVYTNYAAHVTKCKPQKNHVLNNFKLSDMTVAFEEILNKHIKLAKQVQLNLPDINKYKLKKQ